jgi:formate-nitrite transporter family protein
MVWLLPASGGNKVAVIIIMTYIVRPAGFEQIVAGSVETLYLVVTGMASPRHYLGGYMIRILIGNIIGGAALVAILNHAQIVSGDT